MQYSRNFSVHFVKSIATNHHLKFVQDMKNALYQKHAIPMGVVIYGSSPSVRLPATRPVGGKVHAGHRSDFLVVLHAFQEAYNEIK